MGSKVALLYNGKVNAGKHSVIFDATSLPKGIYMGVIATEKETRSFKMVSR
jgi:hypothetical protein